MKYKKREVRSMKDNWEEILVQRGLYLDIPKEYRPGMLVDGRSMLLKPSKADY